MTDQGENDLSLSAAIRSLRNEILSAVAEGKESPVSFTVGPIELEFNVVARRESGGGGSVKFSILGVGAKADGNISVGAERTQRVKFTLTPQFVNANGLRDPLNISAPVAGAGG